MILFIRLEDEHCTHTGYITTPDLEYTEYIGSEDGVIGAQRHQPTGQPRLEVHGHLTLQGTCKVLAVLDWVHRFRQTFHSQGMNPKVPECTQETFL